MSFVEDYIEPYVDAYIDGIEKREFQWNQGIHIDQNDNQYKLSEMTDTHLKNTIRYFRGECDVTPLEEELKKRN